MSAEITSVWEDLEREALYETLPSVRLYRALGASAIGIRAGLLPHQGILELLVEVPDGWTGENVIPAWRGMGHEVVALRLLPREEAHHLRLFLVSPEHREVFLTVCEDLVVALEGIADSTSRVKEIEACLLRWRRFFEQRGPEGLTQGMQQGLFAELRWLQRLLEANVDPKRAVSAWKGCERGYQDFDLGGYVVEVKSTRTKEPLSVMISNERQLDDRGLQSLHLYVLNLQEVDGGGITLPGQVEVLRAALAVSPASLAAFQRGLVNAGYLDRDAEQYARHWVIKAEDLYRVGDGFPRITTVQPGVGDLRYRVFLAACERFKTDVNDHLAELTEL